MAPMRLTTSTNCTALALPTKPENVAKHSMTTLTPRQNQRSAGGEAAMCRTPSAISPHGSNPYAPLIRPVISYRISGGPVGAVRQRR